MNILLGRRAQEHAGPGEEPGQRGPGEPLLVCYSVCK